MAKEGSTISGLMDAFATSISLALQYGVPLQVLVDKFSHTRFEPSGFTKNPEIPIAKSIIDYIFRWLASKFLSARGQAGGGRHPARRVEPAAAPAPSLAARQSGEPVRGEVEQPQGHLPLPAGRSELPRVRLDHGAQRQLLQVPELRLDERMQLSRKQRAWIAQRVFTRGYGRRGSTPRRPSSRALDGSALQGAMGLPCATSGPRVRRPHEGAGEFSWQ